MKGIALFIAAPLCHLVSFAQGTFPDNLKTSVITPCLRKAINAIRNKNTFNGGKRRTQLAVGLQKRNRQYK
jgi:hypothetical protein